MRGPPRCRRRELGLAGLLKLTSTDFQAAISVDHFLHLNAAPCTHVAGGQYAMVPMVTSQAAGHDRTTVDAQMAVRVECLELIGYTRLADVPSDALSLMLGRPACRQALYELMVSRYGRLRGWAGGNVGQMPVVLSRMRNARQAIDLVPTATPTSASSHLRRTLR